MHSGSGRLGSPGCATGCDCSSTVDFWASCCPSFDFCFLLLLIVTAASRRLFSGSANLRRQASRRFASRPMSLVHWSISQVQQLSGRVCKTHCVSPAHKSAAKLPLGASVNPKPASRSAAKPQPPSTIPSTQSLEVPGCGDPFWKLILMVFRASPPPPPTPPLPDPIPTCPTPSPLNSRNLSIIAFLWSSGGKGWEGLEGLSQHNIEQHQTLNPMPETLIAKTPKREPQKPKP